MAEPTLAGDELPPPHVRRHWLMPSLVWIVPIVALIAAIVLATRTWLAAGPQVTIAFQTAEGLEAGRTEVRYKEVVVGRVTAIELSRDRGRVLVSVNLERGAADLAVEDTRFWVVRPRVGAGGVTGLGTILSGAYIGVDAGVSESRQRRFTGLEAPPYFLRGEPGRVFELDARELGSLDLGSPVYYRRVRVGRVVGYALDPARDALRVQVFVEAPNDALVTPVSRFWNASGIDVSLDASGLTVNTESLASLIAGGIAFDNPSGTPLPQPALSEQHRFTLHRTRREALAPPDGLPLRIRMVFEQAPHGLKIDAPVELLGVDVGSVTAIAVQYDAQRRRFPTEVRAEIHPTRLGAARDQMLRGDPSARGDALFVKRLVESGLRAQVRSGNLLTGQLYVALEFVPGATQATLDDRADPLTLPSVPSVFHDTQQQVAEIVKRLGKVKFDAIGAELQSTLAGARKASEQLERTLQNADATIAKLSPDVQHAMADLRRTLAAAQAAMTNVERNITQSDAPLQRNANAALAELQRAARSLRVLSEMLQQHPESLLRGKPGDRVFAPEAAR